MKILVIDNYDSFVYNIVQYIGELGAEPIVYRNNEITPEIVQELNPAGIIISPGPGNVKNPRDSGNFLDIIKNINKPILGVCLGHQGIAYAFGGKIKQSSEIMHGKASVIKHNCEGIFKNIKNPINGMRYHSFVVDEETFPDCLKITARTTEEKEIFGLEHKTLPIFGIQFHPESIGTEDGKKILQNFLEVCK